MGRVTYLHHYLPTLWFAVLMLGLLFDHLVFGARRLSERVKSIVFIGSVGAIVGTFWWFHNAAFGFDGPIRDHRWLQWRSSWNIY